MESGNKPSGNKVIAAVAIFIVLGLLTNMFLNYNQSTQIESGGTTRDEILSVVRGNQNTLEQNAKKLDELLDRVKKLEDNSNKAGK